MEADSFSPLAEIDLGLFPNPVEKNVPLGHGAVANLAAFFHVSQLYLAYIYYRAWVDILEPDGIKTTLRYTIGSWGVVLSYENTPLPSGKGIFLTLTKRPVTKLYLNIVACTWTN